MSRPFVIRAFVVAAIIVLSAWLLPFALHMVVGTLVFMAGISWPHGLKLGPLKLFERMDEQAPLGIFVASWHHLTEHEPGRLRWSFEWINTAAGALPLPWFKPQWWDRTDTMGLYAPARIRTMRLELPVLGMFTLVVGRDLLAAVEV